MFGRVTPTQIPSYFTQIYHIECTFYFIYFSFSNLTWFKLIYTLCAHEKKEITSQAGKQRQNPCNAVKWRRTIYKMKKIIAKSSPILLFWVIYDTCVWVCSDTFTSKQYRIWQTFQVQTFSIYILYNNMENYILLISVFGEMYMHVRCLKTVFKVGHDDIEYRVSHRNPEIIWELILASNVKILFSEDITIALFDWFDFVFFFIYIYFLLRNLNTNFWISQYHIITSINCYYYLWKKRKI